MSRMWICGCVVLALLRPVPAAAQGAPPAARKGIDKQAMYEDIEVMRRILNGQLGHARLASSDRATLATWLGAADCNVCHSNAATSLLLDAINQAAPADSDGSANVTDEAIKHGVRWLQSQIANDHNQSYPPATWSALGSYYRAIGQPNTARQYLYKVKSAHGRPVEFEGAYLKGHGVVYTATIATADAAALPRPAKSPALLATCGHCHDTAPLRKAVEQSSSPTAEQPSRWEKVRREVR